MRGATVGESINHLITVGLRAVLVSVEITASICYYRSVCEANIRGRNWCPIFRQVIFRIWNFARRSQEIKIYDLIELLFG